MPLLMDLRTDERTDAKIADASKNRICVGRAGFRLSDLVYIFKLDGKADRTWSESLKSVSASDAFW